MDKQTYIALSQSDWENFVSRLAKFIGQEVGIEIIPFDLTIASDPKVGEQWMYKANAVEGFVICRLRNGSILEKNVSNYEFSVDIVELQKQIRAAIDSLT